MAQKFLKRKEDKIIEKDEWSYISQIGQKLEIKDVMDVEDRSITFGKKSQPPSKTNFDSTKEGIRWALDAAGNTGQAIKYFNLNVDNQKSQIKKFLEFRERFDREIALLQGYTLEKIRYDQKNLAKLDIRKLTELFNQLLLEKRITQRRLRNMKNELSAIECEVKEQEKEIEIVRRFLLSRVFEGENSENVIDELEAIQTIREEINTLSKQYDISKLSQAIEIVLSPKNKISEIS